MGKRDQELESDAELWARVARSAKPLEKSKAAHAAEAPKPKPKAEAKPLSPAPAKPAPKPALKPKPAAKGEALDRQTTRHLERGRLAVEARLDLHGRTQSEAYSMLLHFLRRAQRDGVKFTLVITGKGARADEFGERGVLKRQVPQWLRLPEFRTYVVGFEGAHAGHGGEGALYVRIKRLRNAD